MLQAVTLKKIIWANARALPNPTCHTQLSYRVGVLHVYCLSKICRSAVSCAEVASSPK
jgi:hypothetical protein